MKEASDIKSKRLWDKPLVVEIQYNQTMQGEIGPPPVGPPQAT